jgi:hypothetical protein
MRSETLLIYGAAFVALLMLAVGMWGLFSNHGAGGFFPGLGKALAVAVLLALNLLLLVLTVVYWVRFGAPVWLKACISLQAVAAAWTLWVVGAYAFQQVRQNGVDALHAQIVEAIRIDDVARWQKLSRRVEPDQYALDGYLLEAAESSAHRSMVALIAMGARPSASLSAVRQTVYTCRGDVLINLSALDMAVARQDYHTIDLLIEVAHESIVQSAVWLAARLDRLAVVQHFVARGMDIRAVRGEILQENESLLVAAASGAAVATAEWLLKEYALPVNAMPSGPDAYRGQAPIHALVRFADDVYAPEQTKAMLMLLVKHGASLEALDFAGYTPLRRAIERKHRELAEILLAAGADRNSLNAADQLALIETLRAPLREPDEPKPYCLELR